MIERKASSWSLSVSLSSRGSPGGPGASSSVVGRGAFPGSTPKVWGGPGLSGHVAPGGRPGSAFPVPPDGCSWATAADSAGSLLWLEATGWLAGCWASLGCTEGSGWLGARKGTKECQGNTATERGSTFVHTNMPRPRDAVPDAGTRGLWAEYMVRQGGARLGRPPPQRPPLLRPPAPRPLPPLGPGGSGRPSPHAPPPPRPLRLPHAGVSAGRACAQRCRPPAAREAGEVRASRPRPAPRRARGPSQGARHGGHRHRPLLLPPPARSPAGGTGGAGHGARARGRPSPSPLAGWLARALPRSSFSG